MHLVGYEQRAVLAAKALRFQQETGCGQVHALALHWFDHECRHIALFKFRFQGRQIIERDRPAIWQERLKALAKIVIAVDGKRAVGQSVK